VFSRRAAGTFVFALLTSSVSCQKKPAGPPPRYAIVRFENLSGDPSLEWVGRAAGEYLSYSLAHALNGNVLNPDALTRTAASLGTEPPGAPGSSAQRAEALVAGATRLISGFIEKSGNRIRITAADEDLATHKTDQIVTAVQPDAFQAIAGLARGISSAASPYLTSSPEVLRLYATGLEENPADAVPDLERALRQDPDFGPAWVALVNATGAVSSRSVVLDLIAKADARKLDPLDRADLDLVKATLGIDRDGRIEALRRVSALSPGDTGLIRSLAEMETSAGRFGEAARDWQRLNAILPNDVDALNQMGYTRAWSGDYQGALQALKDYAQRRPDDPNALDSAGDVEYMYRKFTDAAASYLMANTKSPRFQSGGELYKAAWAQFEAGDPKKADASFSQFRAARTKAGAGGFDLFEADWLYRTGRPKEAVALLRKVPASAATASQLAVWDLIAGDRAAAAKELAGFTQTGSAAVLLARFASLPSATAGEWEQRADRIIHGTGAEGVRRFALGYALLLDGKKDAALPVWEKIVESSPATDFFSRAILAGIKGERPKLELVPDASNVNQMRALVGPGSRPAPP
jgi:tetratricopeptide (TPR) repeat protein